LLTRAPLARGRGPRAGQIEQLCCHSEDGAASSEFRPGSVVARRAPVAPAWGLVQPLRLGGKDGGGRVEVRRGGVRARGPGTMSGAGTWGTRPKRRVVSCFCEEQANGGRRSRYFCARATGPRPPRLDLLGYILESNLRSPSGRRTASGLLCNASSPLAH